MNFVIVGGGLAGGKAAETLRAEGFGGGLTLISDDPERPYERPPLSKGYLLGSASRDEAFVHPPEWYAQNNVDLRLSSHAVGLDPSAHTLTLDGGETVRYDRLLLATGARPRRLDVAGVDLPVVRFLRTLQDADALKAELADGARVVVVGAGWIGLEVAAAARTHGADVTVIEVDSLPLRRVLGDEVAELFARLHRDAGVRLLFNSGVREITEAGVVLHDGATLAADLVVIGIGVLPNAELAAAGGLTVDNGVLVDTALRTSAPDVFACGDVANLDSALLGQRVRVEHWANALNAGPAAALSMLDRPVTYDPVPYFFTDQYDMGMEYAGFVRPGGYDQVVFRGGTSIADGFIVFWLRAGCVLAGMNVNVWDVTDDIQALVRAGYAGGVVDLERLADPDVPLPDLLS